MTSNSIHTGWLPLFDEPPQLQAIATDVRPIPAQWCDYASQVAELALAANEGRECVEVLQLCERLYGQKRIQSAVQFGLAVVRVALRSMNMSPSRLAQRYGYPHIALLIGASIEHRLNLPLAQRGFAVLALFNDLRSPLVELVDVWTACQHTEAWGFTPERGLVYTRLIHAIRSRFGKTGVDQFTPCFAPDEASTLRNIAQRLNAIDLQPPAQWRAYVFGKNRTP